MSTVVEQRRALNYPLSRWYLRPAAGWFAAALARRGVSPHWLTAGNLLCALTAAAILVGQPQAAALAALMVLGAWFCDRTDGQLARCRAAATPLGAWLDANVDELTDLVLHTAVAAAAAAGSGSVWPWRLLVAFLMGKYLLMYGLMTEESREPKAESGIESPAAARRSVFGVPLLQRLYHLPGNADIRVHVLVAALLTGWLTAELACVAVYYNLRWIARYVLVARRLGGAR